MRRKRNDRNYVLYAIFSPNTGDSYIGVTVATGRAFLRSVKVRVQKHMSRTLTLRRKARPVATVTPI